MNRYDMGRDEVALGVAIDGGGRCCDKREQGMVQNTISQIDLAWFLMGRCIGTGWHVEIGTKETHRVDSVHLFSAGSIDRSVGFSAQARFWPCKRSLSLHLPYTISYTISSYSLIHTPVSLVQELSYYLY